MTDIQLEEIHRLSLQLETVVQRLQDAETAISRVMEEVVEARLSAQMLIESAKAIRELGADSTGSWFVGKPLTS